MTAEAVVLNKSAVAMAADSAVTITSGPRSRKTYDTANKLFELIRGRPVGLMFYNNAEFNGVPWETIVKAYRSQHRADAFRTLDEYVESFLAFVADPASTIVSADSERHSFEQTCYSLLSIVLRELRLNFDQCVSSSGRFVRTRGLALVRRATDEALDQVDAAEDQPWRAALEGTDYRQRYRPVAVQMIDYLFDQFGLLARDRDRLVRLVMDGIVKEVGETGYSGVVIAGFGEDEPFPSVQSITVHGRLAGVVRSERSPVQRVTFEDSGLLIPYAQNEMANQYLSGINQRTQRHIVEFWTDWINRCGPGLVAEMTQAVPRLGSATARTLASVAQQRLQLVFQDFLHHMDEHLAQEFIEPLKRSLALLPKDELALVAESMVNLASLRQRMMVDQMQTVGGEIDVALISRGDGFVWLKRKHYFDRNLNPAWTASHSPSPLP